MDGRTEGWDGDRGSVGERTAAPSRRLSVPGCWPGPSCMSLTRPWPLSSLALAGSPLAQQGCAEGPMSWCRSLATAVRCGAVQSCAQAGWNQAAKDMCADCGQIITILTRMAKDSESIQKYLTHECTLLPLRTLVPHCQKVVDTYFTLFITCLEGQIVSGTRLAPSPGGLGMGWGHSGVQGSLLLLVRPGRQESRTGPDRIGTDLPFPLPLCWMCRSFVGRIESTIPKGAIAKSMSQLCRLLPGTIGGMCHCLMEKYTTTVLDLILDKLGPRLICGMLLMCATGENCGPGESWPWPRSACHACITVTGLAKSTVQANSTVADVEAALLGACSGAHLGWQEVGAQADGSDTGGMRPRGTGCPPQMAPSSQLLPTVWFSWMWLLVLGDVP
uniref:Pulmonary surfactant-associated protein B n=1 Tax=Chelydra serpentina TaxID=8475 RepID=A0A8C3S100_CHESE